MPEQSAARLHSWVHLLVACVVVSARQATGGGATAGPTAPSRMSQHVRADACYRIVTPTCNVYVACGRLVRVEDGRQRTPRGTSSALYDIQKWLVGPFTSRVAYILFWSKSIAEGWSPPDQAVLLLTDGLDGEVSSRFFRTVDSRAGDAIIPDNPQARRMFAAMPPEAILSRFRSHPPLAAETAFHIAEREACFCIDTNISVEARSSATVLTRHPFSWDVSFPSPGDLALCRVDVGDDGQVWSVSWIEGTPNTNDYPLSDVWQSPLGTSE